MQRGKRRNGRPRREKPKVEAVARRGARGHASASDARTPREAMRRAGEAVKEWEPPRFLWRTGAAVLLAGQVVYRAGRGRVHGDNMVVQVGRVGPGTLGVAVLTAGFVGMVFTLQFAREFTKLGLTRAVGGVLSLALARELTPVITAVVVAGRVGSAFAAELGAMQVSEQADQLRVLGADPVDYLIAPRVLACSMASPILSAACFAASMAASCLLADSRYAIPPAVLLDSASRALAASDVLGMGLKSAVFGFLVALVSCAWGSTTSEGARGVGESTTAAVVLSLVAIFLSDFLLSLALFAGPGDALAQL